MILTDSLNGFTSIGSILLSSNGSLLCVIHNLTSLLVLHDLNCWLTGNRLYKFARFLFYWLSLAMHDN